MVIDDIFLSQVIGMLAVSLPKRTLRFLLKKDLSRIISDYA